MRLFSSTTARRRGILSLLFVTVVVVGVTALVQQYLPVSDARTLRTWIGQFGVFAPVVFIAIQALQVVVAPIPGQVVALIGGYLFGPVAGTVYSLTGVLIGSTVAFSLAKRYGRPFVEGVLHEDVVDRFDGFVERVGVPGLLVFVVIPGLPDDAICFVSGLTRWRLRTFIAVVSVGRLPAYVLTVYAGNELATGAVRWGMALVAVLVVLSVAGFSNQQRIREFVERRWS